MMTPDDIETALGQRLAAISPAQTTVWQNSDENPARPFLFFQHVPLSRTDATLDGLGETQIGYVDVAVVIDRNTFTTPANIIAAAVMAQFAYGLSLAAGTGRITINKPPEVLRGYRDGPDWRLPVRINYVAEIN